ncbi:DUF3563 domain-containing protein [Robbsia sp. KACC 23696]|uniref:DUF3563 domain-containing protein n=1 Tax=Robbsia sp. KACC 23696 TaxID=3149231 RepID=UPI00325AD6D2
MKLLDSFVALVFRRAAARREARDAAYLAEAADLTELAARMQELERRTAIRRNARKQAIAA